MTQSGLTLQNMAIFLKMLSLQRLVAAQDDDVRRDAHALKLLDGVLGGLGLVLVAAAQEGDEGDVDEQAVAAPLLQPDLADRLNEGLALDIAGRAADLGDDDVGVRSSCRRCRQIPLSRS